jgi:Calcium-dependent channel, 7TM region, putative phosphate
MVTKQFGPSSKQKNILLETFFYHLEITVLFSGSQKTVGFMKRIYFLLFVALFIVPIFNIDSILQMFLEYLTDLETNFQWNCIFLPDNGAYFINSMMLMALFGSSVMLLRWKPLFKHIYYYITSRSWSEIRAQCTFTKNPDFSFDGNMADFLVNFTITNCLAPSSPLVIPFGLTYTLIKHCVDSYCLVSGTFKVSYLNTKAYYLPITNIVVVTTLFAQIYTVACFYLSPVTDDVNIGYVATYGPGMIFVSFGLLYQQFQSDQTWPFRVMKDDVISSEVEETDEIEPIYEPPILEWASDTRSS